MIKVFAKNPEDRAAFEAAALAERMLNTPEMTAWVATETQAELTRQLLYGLPPSEGIPDIRPRFPRYSRD